MIFGFISTFNNLAAAAQSANKTLTIAPIVEARERFERRDHKGFSEKVSDARSDLFSRERLGFGYRYGTKLSGEVVYEYTHDLYWAPKINGASDTSDLLLGYVSDKENWGTLTLGRQRLNIGNQRILGESDWKVASNSWDAVRYQKDKLDLFAGHLEVSSLESKYTKIVGGDFASPIGNTIVMYAHDRTGSVSTDIYTAYTDYVRNLKFATLEFELGGQLGAVGSLQDRAWATNLRLTRQFDKKISGYVAAAAFSGGSTKTTDMEWFTPYASKHPFGGSADIQGSSNAKWLAAEAKYLWSPKFSSELIYHDFFLYNDRDAWINKSFVPNKTGSTTFIDPTGQKGSQVGQEIDLNCRWDFAKNTEFSFGGAEFLPGQFIKNFISPANQRDQMWFFAELGFKFHG